MAGHPSTIAHVLKWHFYILRCADRSYYIGHTRDLRQRVKTHNAGEGATHTACRLPVELVYSESFPNEAEAMAREAQLKRSSCANNEALITGDKETLHQLSRSQD
ncbi:MAG: GIY-YIG nuclease family protein [Verrucomicrobiota bacterium]